MTKEVAVCEISGEEFEIGPQERGVYAALGAELPRISPVERRIQRLAFRNERNLYRRKCDKTGEPMVSLFREDSKHTIYSLDVWWKDDWDPCEFGQEIDFTRPFFEQVNEVFLRTPLPGFKVISCENCEYNFACIRSRNCFCSARIVDSEDIYHCYRTQTSRDCADCLDVRQCELCYECLYCKHCYDCHYATLCDNSSELFACLDCRGCSKCIGCVNLRNKSLHYFNEPITEEEYREIKASLADRTTRDNLRAEFERFSVQFPRRAVVIVNSENCTGDFIFNSKNSFDCYEVDECEDCVYQLGGWAMRDCIDGECNYGSEQLHNSVSNAHGYNCFATVDATEASEQLYTFYSSAGAENQFGCVAIKKKKNCILNTEYSESEYNVLKQKLIAHMKDTGEWGKFFPASMSPFYFQETAGYTYFPLTEEEAKRRSLNWRKESSSAAELAGVNAVDAAALDALTLSERKGAAVKCEVSGRPFKLTLAELKMYEKLGALVPTDHPDERHKRHVHSRGGFELFERFCEQTGEPILTTYSPDTPFVIWSNSAYAEEFDS